MNYTEQQLTAAVVSDGLRPVLAFPESGAPSALLSLIQRCWDAKPQNRPSFNDIVAELGSILEHRETSQGPEVPGRAPSSLGDQTTDISSMVQSFQEDINWFTQGEHLSKRASCEVDSSLTSWLDSFDGPLAYRPVLSWGSFATCGKRESMEDTHFLMPYMCNEIDIHVFGIFDGHRGTCRIMLWDQV